MSLAYNVRDVDDPQDNIEMEQDQVDGKPKQEPRKIQINRQLQEIKFKKNSISTSKYNVLTFLPKFLFEQFQKYSNIFFFAIVMLQVKEIRAELNHHYAVIIKTYPILHVIKYSKCCFVRQELSVISVLLL